MNFFLRVFGFPFFFQLFFFNHGSLIVFGLDRLAFNSVEQARGWDEQSHSTDELGCRVCLLHRGLLCRGSCRAGDDLSNVWLKLWPRHFSFKFMLWAVDYAALIFFQKKKHKGVYNYEIVIMQQLQPNETHFMEGMATYFPIPWSCWTRSCHQAFHHTSWCSRLVLRWCSSGTSTGNRASWMAPVESFRAVQGRLHYTL